MPQTGVEEQVLCKSTTSTCSGLLAPEARQVEQQGCQESRETRASER